MLIILLHQFVSHQHNNLQSRLSTTVQPMREWEEPYSHRTDFGIVKKIAAYQIAALLT